MTRKLIVPQPTGACSGVVNAFTALRDVREAYPTQRISVNHQPVHHREADRVLRELEIGNLDAGLSSLKPGEVVVGSAHGTPESEEREVRARGATFVDAVCPLVAANYGWMDYGRRIVVYVGKSGHREYEATISRMGDLPGRFAVDLYERDLSGLIERIRALDTSLQIALVRQTTIPGNSSDFARVWQTLVAALPEFSFGENRGECYATENRQTSLHEAIRLYSPGLILVLTSTQSSNGMALVKAVPVGIPVLYADTGEELLLLAPSRLATPEVVVLVAAASVVQSVIDDAVTLLCAQWPCEVERPWLVDRAREPDLRPVVIP